MSCMQIVRLRRERKASCSRRTVHLSCNRQSELFAKAPFKGAASSGRLRPWFIGRFAALCLRLCLRRLGSARPHRRRVIRRRTSPSWFRSAPAPAWTCWCGSMRTSSRRRSASRWWSRTSPAPRPCWRRNRSRPRRADGHTLVVLTSSAMAINQSLYKQINYSPENDFVPISLYVKSPFILVANPEPAVQDRAGVHQARQGGEAAAELRVGRRGRVAAPVDGVRQAAVRFRCGPCAVSPDRTIGHRSGRRSCRRRLRRGRRLDPADQGRPAARARGVVVAAAAAAARCAAVLGSRPARRTSRRCPGTFCWRRRRRRRTSSTGCTPR